MSITDELREYVNQTPVPKSRVLMEARERFNAIADRIDAEYERALKQERNKGFTDGYDMGYDDGFASADDWLAQHEDAMAEHGWVRRNKEHVISHATVEVTPHIDWARMADELDEFVEIVRGMAPAEGEDA